jgi:hypothetical protein
MPFPCRDCREPVPGNKPPVLRVSPVVKTAAWLVILFAVLFSAGCIEPDTRENSERRTVALGEARLAQAQVDMGAGELRIEGGAENLLDADFVYSSRERPEVQYRVSGDRGYLSVRQPPTRGIHGHTNRWDLRLNDKAVGELRVNLGAGEAQLKLSGMSLTRLEVDVGAGELRLDLTGPWDKDLEGNVRGGVGEATVRLPRSIGVRVRATGGIGGINAQGLRQEGGYYYNDAYGKSPVKLRLDVTGGIGEINLIG